MLYTRPQLIVLLIVVATAGIGLGVGHWRRTHPEIVERLEQFDRAAAPTAAVAEPKTAPELHARSESRPRGTTTRRTTAGPKTTTPTQPVDVNRATADELRALPGIGGVLAARIIEARERDGPFTSFDDLRRVRGLGRAKLDRLASAVAVP